MLKKLFYFAEVIKQIDWNFKCFYTKYLQIKIFYLVINKRQILKKISYVMNNYLGGIFKLNILNNKKYFISNYVINFHSIKKTILICNNLFLKR